MVLVTLLYGGLGPAIVTMVAALLPIDYFFIDPGTGFSKSFWFKLTVITAEVLVAGVLRKAWERNEKLKREVEAALKSRDQFMAIAAHELRTPISSMKMQIEMMRRKCADGPTQSRLETLDRQVRRLTDLVSSLMDVTRMNINKVEMSPREIDLDDVVSDVVNRQKENLVRSSCELTVKLQGGVTGVWDALRIEQIIVNLVSNACKYGEGKPIEIRTWEDGPNAYFSVQDNGIGIPAEDQKRIFQQFQRAVEDKHYSGLGLGLWITSEIVKAKGGDITVASAPGRGSTFTVKLPRYRYGPPVKPVADTCAKAEKCHGCEVVCEENQESKVIPLKQH